MNAFVLTYHLVVNLSEILAFLYSSYCKIPLQLFIISSANCHFISDPSFSICCSRQSSEQISVDLLSVLQQIISSMSTFHPVPKQFSFCTFLVRSHCVWISEIVHILQSDLHCQVFEGMTSHYRNLKRHLSTIYTNST